MAIYLHGEVQPQENAAIFLMRVHSSHVKLCPVGMHNAILGNDLNAIFQEPWNIFPLKPNDNKTLIMTIILQTLIATRTCENINAVHRTIEK